MSLVPSYSDSEEDSYHSEDSMFESSLAFISIANKEKNEEEFPW
jgi:hypothetical protein